VTHLKNLMRHPSIALAGFHDWFVDWTELLRIMESRLGMYVGRPMYERAFSMLIGFDLARGQGEVAAFQEWMSCRHPGSSLAFTTLVLCEVFGDEATEDRLVTGVDHQLAITNLCRLFREFRLSKEAVAAE
jgi:hypothetical protein